MTEKQILDDDAALTDYEAEDLFGSFEESEKEAWNTVAQQVYALATEKKEIEDEIVRIEEHVKRMKARLATIDQKEIPSLTVANGITSIDLSGLGKLSVKPDYYVSVSDMGQLYAFLKKEGSEEMVKELFTLEAPTPEQKDALFNLVILFEETRKIHPQTLTAYIRRKAERGEEFPEGVKVTPFYKTKIK